MSRIGRQPITIPEGVKININLNQVKVVGPRGELKLKIPEGIGVEKKDDQLVVSRHRDDKKTKACHGTVRSLINNMVVGVTQGWEKELEVVGTGYRVNLEGEKLVFRVGFSHPVVVEPPAGIKFEVNENKIKVMGIDKELVGNIAAKIRKIRPPDAYKGKGIRYSDEVIKLKPGKAAKTGAAGE